MATNVYLVAELYKSEARNPSFETISNDPIPNVQNKTRSGNLKF
jgi:hypothetical protein